MSELQPLLNAIQKIRDRRLAQIEEFVNSDDKAFLSVQEAFDVLREFDVSLCGFKSATTHNGEVVDITTLVDSFKDFFDEKFQELTGRQYVPEHCR